MGGTKGIDLEINFISRLKKYLPYYSINKNKKIKTCTSHVLRSKQITLLEYSKNSYN